jgi:hypothetical protein
VIRETRCLERVTAMERLGHVAEETSDTARAPVGRVIKLRVRTETHEAEEGVLFGIDDDADMAASDNEIARLRHSHACKVCASTDVEFARSDVVV